MERFDPFKAFGFLTSEQFPRGLFVHVTDLVNDVFGLIEGEHVTFELGADSDGRPRARYVRRLQSTEIDGAHVNTATLHRGDGAQ